MNTAESQPDQELVSAAQAEPERFLELYDRYFDRVWAWAIRRTRNRAEAEDVTSEVFRRALENLGSYEWRGVPFLAWLLRIAANALAHRREKLGRESADPRRKRRGRTRIWNSVPCCSNSSNGCRKPSAG